jgi:hypothetical protein
MADRKAFHCMGKLWRTSSADMAQGAGINIPQYCSCGQPMCWGYVSYVEELPSGGEAVHQEMASLSREGH